MIHTEWLEILGYRLFLCNFRGGFEGVATFVITKFMDVLIQQHLILMIS